jgi:hypothetical protein
MFKEGRSSFPRIFMSHKIEVRESPIHGLGVFAKERIEANELIESAPVVLFHKDTKDALSMTETPGMTVDGTLQISGLHDRHVLLDYPFEWKNNMLAFPLGYVGIYNHSTESPTGHWQPNFEYECIEVYSRGVIEPGEEITTRYVRYDSCDVLWFTSDEPNSVLDKPLGFDSGPWRDPATEVRTLLEGPDITRAGTTKKKAVTKIIKK